MVPGKSRNRCLTVLTASLLSWGTAFAGNIQMEGVMGQAVQDLKQTVQSGLKSARPAAEMRGDWVDMLGANASYAQSIAKYVLLLLVERADDKEKELCRAEGILEAELRHVGMFAIGSHSRKMILQEAFDLGMEIMNRANSLGGYCGFPVAFKTPYGPKVAEGDRAELKNQVQAIVDKTGKLEKMLSAQAE